jgi:hypothetical protein
VAQPAADSGLIDIVKRELSDIRFSQSEAGRHTQDSLEAVHNTLGHVVDRLAMIEGDLRTVRAAPAVETPPAPPQAAAPRVAMPPQPKPELPIPLRPRAFCDGAAGIPRSTATGAGRCPGDAARHQRNSRAAHRVTALRDRA